MANNINLQIFLTPIKNESRLFKQAKAILNAEIAERIDIIGLNDGSLPSEEELFPNICVHRINLATRSLPKNLFFQVVKYIEWCFTIFLLARRKNINSVQAHSLAALPPAVMIKFVKKVPLIYDAHELETEIHSLSGIRKKLSRFTEKTLLKFVDQQYVVSDSIADWYVNNFHIERPATVRNIPETTPVENISSPLRDHLNLKDSERIIIYTGNVSPGRGITRLIDLFDSEHFENSHLVIMGPSKRPNSISSQNIHYLPAVKPHEVILWVSGADVGLCLTEDTCLSHRFSLPNKLFEAIKSGLPLITCDLPEIKKIISTYECGWVVESNSKSLTNCIINLTPDDISKKSLNAKRAANLLDWNKEATIFIENYPRSTTDS